MNGQNDLVRELEKHVLARLGVSNVQELLGNYGVAITPVEKVLPESASVGEAVVATVAEIAPVTSSEKEISKYPLIKELEDKELLLLKLFNEFTKKDEGRVLASELGKFARYVQSEVSKTSTA